MWIAIAGNPNAGKTTLFNALTGASARVGNYPGVTVEQKKGTLRLPDGKTTTCIDLPGCYSLTARSSEEHIAHEALVGRLHGSLPNAVVCVVDATQLARGLYLVMQLIEMGLPVLVALNMMDLTHQRGQRVNVALLERRLGVPVVPITARTSVGVPHLLRILAQPIAVPTPSARHFDFSVLEERAIATVRQAVPQPAYAHSGEQEVSLGTCLWLLSSNLDTLVDALPIKTRHAIERERQTLDPSGSGDFGRRLIAARYRAVDHFLTGVVSQDQTRAPSDGERVTQALDRVLLHPLWGLVVFLGAMFALFQGVFAGAEPLITAVEQMMDALAQSAERVIPAGFTQSLMVQGVLAGVGNVLAFLPQIALLFMGITMLEESGYMARAAVLLDRLMRRVGLHGKAFIPLLSSFGCAVPGIMAARTVESHRDRLITILVAPFMSCSARLPIYTLVIAAVFANEKPLWGVLSIGGLIIFAMYSLGFAAALGTTWLLKRTVLRSPVPPLLLELPIYRVPEPRTVALRVFERCRVFLKQTGTVILALSVLLWGVLTFPQVHPSRAELQAHIAKAYAHGAGVSTPSALTHVAYEDIPSTTVERHLRAYRLEHSWGGRLGHAIEPIIAPLGFDWRIGIGLLASFAAREVLISTLGQVYALDQDDTAPTSPSLRHALTADIDPRTQKPRFSALTGICLMVFFVLALQCMSTVATVRRETQSWRWPLAQLIYMNTLAYVVTLIVYQSGRALGWG